MELVIPHYVKISRSWLLGIAGPDAGVNP